MIYQATPGSATAIDRARTDQKLLEVLMGDGPPIFIHIEAEGGERSEAILTDAARRLATTGERDPEPDVPEAHRRVRRRLVECNERGQPLVAFFFREHETGTELLARRMVSSAIGRRAHVKEAVLRWRFFQEHVKPWLEAERPSVAKVAGLAARRAPPWIRGDDRHWFGWRSNASAMREAVLTQSPLGRHGRRPRTCRSCGSSSIAPRERRPSGCCPRPASGSSSTGARSSDTSAAMDPLESSSSAI
jgi:hypothetical protein